MLSTKFRFVSKKLCEKKVISVFFVRNFKANPAQNQDKNILECDVKVKEPNFSGIHEYVFSKYEKFGDYQAFECSVSGRKYTYNEIRTFANNFSKNLRYKLKLKRGDVVALILNNIPEFPVAALGIYGAGCILTTVNPLFTPSEISRQLKSSTTKCVITVPALYSKVKSAIGELKEDIFVICIKDNQAESLPLNTVDFFELSKTKNDGSDIKPSNASDVCTILYSSGTTGLPKGVMMTHEILMHEQCVLDVPGALDLYLPTESHQDVIPMVLPMFHAFGLVITMLCMSTHGVKGVTIPKFTPENLISVLKDHKISVIGVVPPLVSFLINYPHMKGDYLKNLRYAICGAASLPVTAEAKFFEKYGTKDLFIGRAYGSTEGGSTAITKKIDSTNSKLKNCKGSCGTVHANVQIKVVPSDNPGGTPLGHGEKGEILVKSKHVMKGYLNNPGATKEAIQDGWFKTGDIGYFNENKQIFVCDRIKDLIKVKGYQVAPAELEEVLRNYPSVKEVAVIGVPHERYGEVPRAYVVPKSGENLCTVKLNDYFNEKMAKYKQLVGGIEIIEDIPKNATGKILKKNLKMQYETMKK